MIMKRILAGVLAIFLFCAIVSCGKNDRSTDEIYAAIEKTAALENSNGSFDVKMRMTQGLGYLDTTVSGSTKKTVMDGERITETKMTVDYGVSKSEESVLIVGDTAYMLSDVEKTKLPASYALSGMPELDLSLIEKGSIESITACEDGSWNLQIKSDSLNGLLDLFLGMNRSDGNVYDKISFNIAVSGDGYVTECRMSFEMSGKDADLGDYGATVEGVFTYDSPGSEVSIDLPDLSEYSYPAGFEQ